MKKYLKTSDTVVVPGEECLYLVYSFTTKAVYPKFLEGVARSFTVRLSGKDEMDYWNWLKYLGMYF